MKNWTRKNWFRDISLSQFKSLTENFQARAEAKYGQGTHLYIRLMDGHFTVGDGTASGTRHSVARNDENTFKSTNSLSSITAEDWDKAVSADVVVKPVNGRKKDISHIVVDGKTAKFHLR